MRISEAKDLVVKAAVAVVNEEAGALKGLHRALHQLSEATPDVAMVDAVGFGPFPKTVSCTCGWVGTERGWWTHSMAGGVTHLARGQKVDEMLRQAKTLRMIHEAINSVRAYVDKAIAEVKAIPGKDHRFLSEQMLALNERLGRVEKWRDQTHPTVVNNTNHCCGMQKALNKLHGRVAALEQSKGVAHPAVQDAQLHVLRTLQARLTGDARNQPALEALAALYREVRAP